MVRHPPYSQLDYFLFVTNHFIFEQLKSEDIENTFFLKVAHFQMWVYLYCVMPTYTCWWVYTSSFCFIGMSDPQTYVCGEFGLCVVGCCCKVLSTYCPFIVTIIVQCVPCKNSNTNRAECQQSCCMDVTWLSP